MTYTLLHSNASHRHTSECVMRSIRDILVDIRSATQALGSSAAPADVLQLRTHCEKVFAGFARALDVAGFAPAARDGAVQALSCFIEQEIAHHLNADAQHLWDVVSAEVATDRRTPSSTEILERMRRQLQHPQPDLHLLECYAAVLRLGLGRRTNAGNAIGLQALAESLNTVVAKLRVAATQAEELASLPNRWIGRLEQSPSWLLIGVCSSLALCLYRYSYLLLAQGLFH